MPNKYRATADFDAPASAADYAKAKAGKKPEIAWMHVQKGKPVVPYNHEVEKAWLAAGLIEEVKAGD